MQPLYLPRKLWLQVATEEEVARQDTLVHWGGDTEVLTPTNFNPYSLAGWGEFVAH